MILYHLCNYYSRTHSLISDTVTLGRTELFDDEGTTAATTGDAGLSRDYWLDGSVD